MVSLIDISGGGGLRLETVRGEGSAGWICTPNGVSAGWILIPTGVLNFHKNDPKRVAKFENFTNNTQREWLKTKIWYPTGLKTQPEGVPEVKKGNLKGSTSLLTLTEGGYFSNLACDWLSIVWAYSERRQITGPVALWFRRPCVLSQSPWSTKWPIYIG